MSDSRHAALSFRPAPRVARDEEFDDSLFDRAARSVEPPDDDPEGEAPPPAREGLPASYRMRHDAHYVEQIASRRHAEVVQLVPVAEIDGPHPLAPPHDLQPLVQSIAKVGVLQPLLVRRHNGRYELIAGARRLAAAVAAGVDEVPCLVHAADEERARILAEAESVIGRRHGGRPADLPEPRIPMAVFAELTEHLGAIGACLQLFGDRDRPLRERVAIGLVQAEVQRAAWLAQSLGALAGDPPLDCNPVDLAAVARRVLAAFGAEGGLAGVEYDLECTGGSGMVRGDEQLLSIALAGMLASISALVERVPDARVGLLVAFDRAAGTMRVEVSEQAVALPASARARFFDLAWAERPGGAGVGAGLAAARRIAELHGGGLELHAGEGGCRLTLRLRPE